MAAEHALNGHGAARVLPTTRLLGAAIVPFLVAAWAILYLAPERTEELFAWPIQPTMTARLLGAIYLGGAYFFVRVVFARHWRSVALGFLPVAAFAALMGVATVLHWDRFAHGHISFVAWAGLYFTTPVLVVAAWWANQRYVTRQPMEPADSLSRSARTAAGGLGSVAVAMGLALFVWPQRLLDVWPWALTPLTARVVAGICVLGGAGIGIARLPLWDAARVLLHVLWIMLGLTLLATGLAWNEFDRSGPATWAFVVWILVVLLGSVLLYGTMERKCRQQPDAATR